MCKNACLCKTIYQEFEMNSSGQVNFPAIEQLRNLRVKGLFVRPNASDTAKTKGKKTLPPPAVLATTHVEIKDQNGNIVVSAPIELFFKDSGTTDYFCLDLQFIDPAASIVYFDTAATGFAATDYLEFTWVLECPKQC